MNTHTWHTPDVQGARPPVRDSHAAVALGNRMVLYGGDCGKEYLSDVWAYDVLQQRWQAFKVLLRPQQWVAILADDIAPLLTSPLCHLSTEGVVQMHWHTAVLLHIARQKIHAYALRAVKQRNAPLFSTNTNTMRSYFAQQDHTQVFDFVPDWLDVFHI